MSEWQSTNRLTLPPWRPVGEVVAELTAAAGRMAIARCLERASEGDRRAFGEADTIRKHLGLAWTGLVHQRCAA